jgi:hypothetical protein
MPFSNCPTVSRRNFAATIAVTANQRRFSDVARRHDALQDHGSIPHNIWDQIGIELLRGEKDETWEKGEEATVLSDEFFSPTDTTRCRDTQNSEYDYPSMPNDANIIIVKDFAILYLVGNGWIRVNSMHDFKWPKANSWNVATRKRQYSCVWLPYTRGLFNTECIV